MEEFGAACARGRDFGTDGWGTRYGVVSEWAGPGTDEGGRGCGVESE